MHCQWTIKPGGNKEIEENACRKGSVQLKPCTAIKIQLKNLSEQLDKAGRNKEITKGSLSKQCTPMQCHWKSLLSGYLHLPSLFLLFGANEWKKESPRTVGVPCFSRQQRTIAEKSNHLRYIKYPGQWNFSTQVQQNKNIFCPLINEVCFTRQLISTEFLTQSNSVFPAILTQNPAVLWIFGSLCNETQGSVADELKDTRKKDAASFIWLLHVRLVICALHLCDIPVTYRPYVLSLHHSLCYVSRHVISQTVVDFTFGPGKQQRPNTSMWFSALFFLFLWLVQQTCPKNVHVKSGDNAKRAWNDQIWTFLFHAENFPGWCKSWRAIVLVCEAAFVASEFGAPCLHPCQIVTHFAVSKWQHLQLLPVILDQVLCSADMGTRPLLPFEGETWLISFVMWFSYHWQWQATHKVPLRDMGLFCAIQQKSDTKQGKIVCTIGKSNKDTCGDRTNSHWYQLGCSSDGCVNHYHRPRDRRHLVKFLSHCLEK